MLEVGYYRPIIGLPERHIQNSPIVSLDASFIRSRKDQPPIAQFLELPPPVIVHRLLPSLLIVNIQMWL
ncbi:hypothetical protein HanOQP8_Chr13g0473931 [Helianthus annuus]|nr:hypothetical protein HanOQP8_Chr13g0473931 [Helianthus annuus]